MPPRERDRWLRSLTPEQAEALLYDWSFLARPNQLAPAGDWRVWLILAGRGFGKTRIGAEWIRARVESRQFGRIGLIGQTAADVRDVMIEGESGLLAISPRWNRPKYEPSKRRLTWPNGAMATTFSGDEPDQLRGPQHDTAWADEPAKWKYGVDAWDNLEMGLRLGANPQVVATTTPRPIKLIKDLLTDAQTVLTSGSTYENAANLAPSFIRRVVKKYEGTRLGRQELHAVLLDDNPRALWQRARIEALRVRQHPPLKRVVVAIDPPGSSEEEAAEAGIVVAGVGIDDHAYVTDDLSLHASPYEWASAAVTGYHSRAANLIVGEVNHGGEMVGYTVSTVDVTIPFKAVRASRSKYTRAEPIAALYEKGTVHHVGMFAELEDQLCGWVPGEESPDRLDALVWALTELMLDEDEEQEFIFGAKAPSAYGGK